MSEYGPRIESCDEISNCLWEKSIENKSLTTSVSSKNIEVLMDYAFETLQSVADKHEFTLG